MEMSLRFAIFPADLDAIADFYTRVLRFSVVKDQRHDPAAHVSMKRGTVQVGAARRSVPGAHAVRRPPGWNWCLKLTM